MLNRRDFLKSAGALATTSVFGQSAAYADANQSRPASASASGRTVVSLNKGWRFHEGDIAFPVIRGHGWTYANAKAGSASGAAAPGFDDSEWSNVMLPHDFASTQVPEESANAAQGYRKRGIGWYRALSGSRGRPRQAHRTTARRHRDPRHRLVQRHAVAHTWSGYNSVYIDLTPFARLWRSAQLAVIRADANAMQGWWYEGAGMYRHTWLVKRERCTSSPTACTPTRYRGWPVDHSARGDAV